MPGMPRPFALLLVLALGLLAMPALALARKPLVISAIATQTSDRNTAKAVIFKETLRDAKTGALLGHDVVTCVPKGQAATCTATFTFAKGTLKVAGTVKQGVPLSKLAVRRGTGLYAGRTGTVTLIFRSQTQALETFDLR
jgi:hypothetical protein